MTKQMTTDELREAFLRFFESKGHTRLPSSSLVPHGDPTLLFTSAGMVQMKPYFLGEATPPNVRLTTAQKCFRTTDIESVGDTSHCTFFEMMGNFSVGDYFKQEAIEFAWEFVTQWLELPPERLWATVYVTDDVAYNHWRDVIKLPPERIMRYGEAEGNFWGPAGETGPCGPCSELHYDFGPQTGCGQPDCQPSDDCGRFLEVWNLVFMEFNQDSHKNRTPLPRQNIDTGMGLERVAQVIQGVESIYDTDDLRSLVDRVEQLTGHRYGSDPVRDRATRVVVEHSRAVTFLVGDGVYPGSEGRGYVLRRVLRRAVRFGRVLGLDRPFLGELVAAVIARYGHVYTDLPAKRDVILRAVEQEEARFRQTLNQGLTQLDKVIAEVEARGERIIPGEEVFRLYDTFGFPKEVTAEVAEERGLTLDDGGYQAALERQREQARAAHRFQLGGKTPAELYRALGLPATTFLGYETLTADSRLLALLVEGEPVDQAFPGQEVELILAETPFYAEGGGQVGDAGELHGRDWSVQVEDTTRPAANLIVHRGQVVTGVVRRDDAVRAVVPPERRWDTMRHHTGTHLLHAALRRVLGPHVQQAGSLVAPDRLRFDFSHGEPLSADDFRRIETLVNREVRGDVPVRTELSTLAEATRRGAMAFFEDKYGDQVRLVEIPEADGDQPDQRPYSLELCGGTHVHETGQIGQLIVLGESSIGAGVRRIEALAGRPAENAVRQRLLTLDSVARQLRASPAELADRVAALQAELAASRKRVEELQRQLARQGRDALLDQRQQVDGVSLIAAEVEAASRDDLRDLGDWLRDKLGSGVVVLGAVLDDKPAFLVLVTDDLVKQGYHAGNIIKKVATIAGGGGGGQPRFAQAGGRDPSKLPEAIKAAPSLLR